MVRLFHLLNRGNKGLFIIGKELTSCLSRANVHAFNENRYRICTELTFIPMLLSHAGKL